MSAFLLVITEQYLAEKKFVKETETIRMQEYYLLCSLKEAEALLKLEQLPQGGFFSYQNGDVTFQKQAISVNTDQITFSLKLKSGVETLGIGQYDKEKREMVKWIEKN